MRFDIPYTVNLSGVHPGVYKNHGSKAGFIGKLTYKVSKLTSREKGFHADLRLHLPKRAQVLRDALNDRFSGPRDLLRARL